MQKKNQSDYFHSDFVPRAGIEPALPKEQDFESSASTSSATEAFRAANILLNFRIEKSVFILSN